MAEKWWNDTAFAILPHQQLVNMTASYTSRYQLMDGNFASSVCITDIGSQHLSYTCNTVGCLTMSAENTKIDHNCFMFRNHLGEPVPEENCWTLWCKGARLTEANTPTIWIGTTPSGLTSAHLHHPPFFTGQRPFMPPNQQCQSTEGN